MINKQVLREAVAEVLESNNHHTFQTIPEEVLNSKEFIQKIYKKNFRLFQWLPLHLDTKDVYNEVIAEQDKILLGNAFNQFCRDAKLIKPSANIDLDNMNSKEQSYFKAFKPMYDENQAMLKTLYEVSDYASYGIAASLSNEDEFNYFAYNEMKSRGSLHSTLERAATETIEKIKDKFYE